MHMGYSRVAVEQSKAEVKRYRNTISDSFGHAEQHAGGCFCFARYNFLLVFSGLCGTVDELWAVKVVSRSIIPRTKKTNNRHKNATK